MSVSLSSKIEFQKLCNLFERIFRVSGAKKAEELQRFTRECRDLASKIKKENPDADTSLFPIFRLILPTEEREERGPYGLKTLTLGNLYIRVFCLGKNSLNAEKLMSRKPLNESSKNEDFADKISWLVRNRLQKDSTLTIHSINKFLDEVARCNKENQKKDDLFMHLTRTITTLELKWLTRILLKDLRLGLNRKKVFEAIHPEAEALFNVTSNLRRVCDQYSDLHSSNLGAPVGVEIFSHIKPMLLERLKIEKIGKVLNGTQEFYVQPKFDGERSQLHMKDGRFKYFTRKGYDITQNASYGEYADSGRFLTANIAKLLNKNCRSIILDGELMPYHKQRKVFGSKGLNLDIKKVTEKSQHQPCFVAYDILLYNDQILIDKPYFERLEILNTAFTQSEGILIISELHKVTNTDEVMKIFNDSLDKDEEGIVVKKCDVTYKPNIRDKSGCYKIKAEYSDSLVHDLDLVILGGYYGHGRCSGIVSSFLVGVASPPTNKNGMPSEFHAVSGVRSGLSDADLKSIQDRLRPHWSNSKPTGISAPRTDVPDLWVSPKNSLVLQLRASEIIKTKSYPIGYCLRFPRVLKVRYDKSWFDTCSTNEFMSLVKDRGVVQKLTKRKVTAGDIDEFDDGSDDEEKPKVRRTMPGLRVPDNFTLDRQVEVTRISRLFEDKEFCVINGNDELDKNQISIIVREHMGRVVLNPGKDTFCVIVGDPTTLKAKNVIASQKYDVVGLSWLKRATKQENFSKIQDFYPWELYSTIPATQQKLDVLYDEFYDHFVENATEESLKRSLEKADEMLDKEVEISISEIKKLDKLLFDDEISPYSVFRGITGYFGNKDDIAKYSFDAMGGTILDEYSNEVNFIFVDDDVADDELQKLRNPGEGNEAKSPKIVNTKWIQECFKNRKLLPIDSYIA